MKINTHIKQIKAPLPSIQEKKLDELNGYRKILHKIKLWYWFDFPYIFPYPVRKAYDSVRFWLNPRNRWATDVIPNRWSDKTYLIPEFLYAAIIDFVDGEQVFERVVLTKKQEREIRECYEWAKYGRHEMEIEISEAYPPAPKDILEMFKPDYNKGKSYDELYGKVNALEAKLAKMDTKYLTWIVRNRELLWT